MAATKLNPSAQPFPRPQCSLHHPAPAAPHPYHAAGACHPPCAPPVGAIYVCAQLPVFQSPHHHPFIQFPVIPAPPGRFLRRGVVSGKKPPAGVLRKGVFPAKPSRLSRKSVPAAAQSTTKTPREAADVPAPPEEHDLLLEDVGEPAPHGLPPHKLMIPSGGAKRKQQQAMAEVAKNVAVACRQEPAPEDAKAAAAPAQKPAARLARRKLERGRTRKSNSSKVRDGAVVGPRAARPRPRARAWAWAPTSVFTKPREVPLPERPPAFLGACTTVMVRNIPNRLKGDEMIALLDEHCARANRVAGAVVSAYDVVYLPMDFRRQGNFGYAFVNFTTANAALLLYHSLQGCGWKVCGSGKRINIVAAKIQGKDALVRHFNRQKFECDTQEYLPAVFTPPRDGGACATATTTVRLGKLAPRFVNKTFAVVVRSKV